MKTPIKKQTPMMKLLEWCKEFDDKNYFPTHTNMKEKIWQLLPEERQMVIDAHCEGQDVTDTAGVSDAKEYFELTYNNKQNGKERTDKKDR